MKDIAKRALPLVLCICLTFALLAGCTNNGGGDDNTTTTDAPTTQNTPADTSTTTAPPTSGTVKDSLTISESNPVNSLDPTGVNTTVAHYLFSSIFSTLVKQPEVNNIVGDLAEDYNVSDDGLVYTFNIRSDAKFHDGTPVTAEDAAFSVEAARTNQIVSYQFPNVDSVSYEGDTVTVTMTRRDRSILLVLCQTYILPKAQFEELGAEGFGTVLNGSGPFILTNYDNATGNWTVTRNEDYYGTKSALKTINYRPIADVSTRLIALEKGEIDYCTPGESNYSLVANNNDLVAQLESSDVNPNLSFNTKVAPFDNKTLRQAIAYALDHEALGIIMSEMGYTNNTQLWSTLYWGKDVPDVGNAIEYSPEKAKELLAEAGITTPYDIGSILTMSNFQSLTEQMQADLAAVGINCTIESVDPNTWVQRYVTGDYTMTYVSQTFSQDKAQFFSTFFKTGSSGNYTLYSSPEMDALIDQLNNAATDTEVDSITLEIIKLLNEDVPMLHLFDRSIFYAYNKDLVVKVDGRATVDLSSFYWAN